MIARRGRHPRRPAGIGSTLKNGPPRTAALTGRIIKWRNHDDGFTVEG